MSYITEIFDRLDLQHIREFLLYGVDCIEVSNKSYIQRLEEAENLVLETINKKFPNMEEGEKIAGTIHNYASVTEHVYMEIGMHCGAALGIKLLENFRRE